MKTYTREQLMEILELHRRWIMDGKGGTRAELSESDLSEANLSYADLSGANLRGADLSYANLSGANLSESDLSESDLREANVSRVRGKTMCSIGNIGSRNATTVYNADDDAVFCGCFRGSLEEFTEKVRAKYGEGTEHREDYELAISLFERKLAAVKQTKAALQGRGNSETG